MPNCAFLFPPLPFQVRSSPTKLVCAVGSRNGTEETKLLVLDFDVTPPSTLATPDSIGATSAIEEEEDGAAAAEGVAEPSGIEADPPPAPPVDGAALLADHNYGLGAA